MWNFVKQTKRIAYIKCTTMKQTSRKAERNDDDDVESKAKGK